MGRSGRRWVAPSMDHHLVLILAKIMYRITLIGGPVKGWNRKLLEKFTFQYALRKGGVGCIGGDDSEFVVV